MTPERDATAYRECTRDPIFLFQRRRWIVTGCPEGWSFDDEGDCIPEGWKPTDEKDTPPVLSMQEMAQHRYGEWDAPCAIETWETESVWLSREEAEDYGKARHYNYTSGWRVYCVCAEGRLGDLLREHA